MFIISWNVRWLIPFLIVFLMILNPYTVIGPAVYFLLPLLVFPLTHGGKLLRFDDFYLLLFLVLISLVGVFSSFAHGIYQLNHLKVSISIVIYYFLVYSVFIIFNKRGFDFNTLVLFVLLGVVFNSIVILIQVEYPPFRTVIESFLVPSGNIDWTEGFRYRGVASGGGASLSVLITVAIVLALHLYSEKVIGLLMLSLLVFIMLVSLFFIGRTGFFLLPVVFSSFIFFNLKKHLLKVSISFSIAVLLGLLFGDVVKDFVVEQYGIGFYNYSFGFFLGGIDGIKEEGTVNHIVEFLRVMPTTFPEVIIGYGFYGGSDFEPWTDSGYSRMFLSVGYFFGVSFYLAFFLIFRNVMLRKIFKSRRFLFLTVGLVLLIAEAKEPLIFSGYASRVYMLLLGYSLFEYNFLKRTRKMNSKNIVSDRFERLS